MTICQPHRMGHGQHLNLKSGYGWSYFTVGFRILVRQLLYIELGPWSNEFHAIYLWANCDFNTWSFEENGKNFTDAIFKEFIFFFHFALLKTTGTLIYKHRKMISCLFLVSILLCVLFPYIQVYLYICIIVLFFSFQYYNFSDLTVVIYTSAYIYIVFVSYFHFTWVLFASVSHNWFLFTVS